MLMSRKGYVPRTATKDRLAERYQAIKNLALKGWQRMDVARVFGMSKPTMCRLCKSDGSLESLFNLNKRVRQEWGVNAPNQFSPEQKFWAQVDKRTSPNGCWEFKGTTTWQCYGRVGYKELLDRFGFKGKYTHSHRMAFAMHHGSIDHSLTVDHLCHNRKCCNPAHLRQCTRAENSKRRWHHVMGERPANMPELVPKLAKPKQKLRILSIGGISREHSDPLTRMDI